MMTEGEFQLAQRFVKAFEAIALAQAKIAGVAGRAESRAEKTVARWEAEEDAALEEEINAEAGVVPAYQDAPAEKATPDTPARPRTGP